MKTVKELGNAIIGIGVANLLIIGVWFALSGWRFWNAKFSELDWLGQIVILIFFALAVVEGGLVIIMEVLRRKYKNA